MNQGLDLVVDASTQAANGRVIVTTAIPPLVDAGALDSQASAPVPSGASVTRA
jgi:hypothetical protein